VALKSDVRCYVYDEKCSSSLHVCIRGRPPIFARQAEASRQYVSLLSSGPLHPSIPQGERM